MTQVTQLVIESSPLAEARNMALAIIDLAKHRDLTPGQYRDRLHAIDMLAREVHDTIGDAEKLTNGDAHDSLSWRPDHA